MRIDALVPADPAVAARMLTEAETKDLNEEVCQFPGCDEPRRAGRDGPGTRPIFCLNEEHTSLNNLRLRRKLRLKAYGKQVSTPTIKPDPSPQGTVTNMTTLLREMNNLFEGVKIRLDDVQGILIDLSDPELLLAEKQEITDQAKETIAHAEKELSQERARRLAAEAAKRAAEEQLALATDGLETAIREREELEVKYTNREEQIQRSHAEEIDRLRVESENREEAVREKAKNDIEEAQRTAHLLVTDAQTARKQAEEEMIAAKNERDEAQDTARRREEEAHRRIAVAEEQVNLLRDILERERARNKKLEEDLSTRQREARQAAEQAQAENRSLRERFVEETTYWRNELSQERARNLEMQKQLSELQKQLLRFVPGEANPGQL